MSEIRISSGRLHVSDRNVFGVYTLSRHPDVFYAAYSLSVGEMRKCFFWSRCMPSNSLSFFPLFLLMFVGWTTRSKFCLVSPVIDHKTQR